MSLECLSATLPKKRGLLLSFQSKITRSKEGASDSTKEIKQTQTPTSGSSSGTIRKTSFDPDETSSQPDQIPDESQHLHSPNTLFSPEEISFAGSPDLEFRILQLEPQSALFKSPQKLGSFFGAMRARSSALNKSTEFDDDFYERIEDFLDQEGLDIVLPAECDQSMIASRTAVRKLLIGRTLSENVIGTQDFGLGVDFGDSPGLTTNIKASSLVVRRCSLGHASSNEIEEAHQTMLIKKSLFESELKELNEIVEVSETHTLSRRSSFMLPQARGSRKTTRKMTGRESEWDDSFSDLHRSGTRQSTQNSTYLFLGDEQVKSLSKLSPDMKPTALSSKRANFYSPQVGLKTLNNELAKRSPLAMFCRNSSLEQKPPLGSRKTVEISPFGGFANRDPKTSSISDISPQLKKSLNE